MLRLKTFIYHNPNTEEPEKVYEFPMCCASESEVREHGGRHMYSRQPLVKPILFILPNYLTEIPNQRISVDESPSLAQQQQQQQQTDL